MARTDDDTWDLASSVGATATIVAAARARATRAPNALIDDPFAEPLVRAVGVEAYIRLATGDPEIVAASGRDRLTDTIAVRTRFFDDFFLDAAAAGVRQAVILASGLDARAYRLPWPADTVVYEIDQPEVLEFKAWALADLGAVPAVDRRPVGIDLRQDWPAALADAGFDTSLPTAWSAEGLLGYLPPEAQDSLLDTVTALSAPGSRFATGNARRLDRADRERRRERMLAAAERRREAGLDLDLSELVYFGDRKDVGEYLTARDWHVRSSTAAAQFEALGLPPLPADAEDIATRRYIVATRA
ncbi:SAM-dependent methyltransferase [Nocardia sp. alder85J]|uniref:SAM-dependent methyltransferase n=1 Tax=Nocardia sp. alder85J TaxID=2862949 RepID=UPI002B1CC9F4|nr:SAM-dependent methyltransferase [Nocardia sp. alder85J]